MRHICLLLLLAGCFPLIAPHWVNAQSSSVFETLVREDAIDLEIETDLAELINNRRRDDYQPAILRFRDSNGKQVEQRIEVVPRGKFRRRICDFPPVKIKFPKKELLSAGLLPHNNLKLSTHCLNDKQEGSQNVFKELLAYKLYNILTPNSFRVQLARITYIDALGGMTKIKRYGFLIEDDEEMAERMGGQLCDCLNAGADSISAFDQSLMATFNYMIGNEDWSLPMVRNLKMVQPASGAPIVPVAYDFDFSGLVSAVYALPDSDLSQRHIKDRDYLGFKVPKEVFAQVKSRFIQKKPELFQFLARYKWLTPEEKEEIKSYLESFYRIIDQLPPDAAELPPFRFTVAPDSGFSGG